MSEGNINYIKCGKHDKRPWSIVCKHLIDGGRDWNPVPQDNDSGLNDWVCNACLKNWDKIVIENDVSMVRPVCVDCVDAMRFLFGRNGKGNK